MDKLHVVLGAGQIGQSLAGALVAQGKRVRLVRRGPHSMPGVEAVQADVADPAQARRALDGASVVFHCMSPPYHRWLQELSPLQKGLLTALRGAPARLVVLDNLYAFGPMRGGAMSAGAREVPNSRKGTLRKQLADELLAEHRAGNIRVTIGRSSDFFGPGIVQAHLGERFFQRVFKGKAGECMGDPTLPHAFTFSGDVVNGLMTLAVHDSALGQIWHLPTLAAVPVTTWTEALAKELGISIRMKTVPAWAVTVLGLFAPPLRELKEMRYQWAEPYLVDDEKTRKAFGIAPTPFELQVRATARWARMTYGQAATAGELSAVPGAGTSGDVHP